MNILILGAGLGSRFFSNSSKINVSFWGMPVINIIANHAVNCLQKNENVYAILRKDNDINFEGSVKKIYQNKFYGTGAAVLSYLEEVGYEKDVLVIPGDAPLIDEDTIQLFQEKQNDADILVGIMPTPIEREFYGRVFINDGKIQKIVEYKHHNEKTEYVNSGILFCSKKVLHLIHEIEENNGEIYLTSIVEKAIENNFKVLPIFLSHEQALGFNTIQEFHQILEVAQNKWRKLALQSQAIFFDINSVYLSYDTKFELGSIVEPYCKFLPKVQIGSKGYVKSFSCLENCYINGTVGPFAHIKSGEIQEDAQIGAFVEISASKIGKKSKAKHLAYIGNSEIEENVNIGAGCVICNYDGKKKHQTKIRKNSFIGANSTLIAPIEIGENSFLAAGGTYTENSEENSFVIARTKQINKKRKDI